MFLDRKKSLLAGVALLFSTQGICQTAGTFQQGSTLGANQLNSAFAAKADWPVNALAGITFSGTPASGNVPIASSGIAAAWGQLSSLGGVAFSGPPSAGNVPIASSGTAAAWGQLSALGGVTFSGTPSANQVPIASSGTAAAWGLLTGASITTNTIANSNLANMAAGTTKCNATGSAAAPTDCTGQTLAANLLGYCVIDGQTFAATMAGIQAAINTAACKDIYVPAGTYNGTTTLTIARSTLRLHGASGIGDNSGGSFGTNGSSILNFTSCIAGNSVQIGDGSVDHTYNGVSLEDLSVVVPGSCVTNGVDIKISNSGVSGLLRRVRITTPSPVSATSHGVNLESGVYGWQFEDVTVDHWGTGYNFNGTNHFTRVTGGQCNNNNVCAQTTTSNSQNITFTGVDIEGNINYGLDIQGAQGFVAQNNFFDNNASINARAIRVGGGANAPIGVTLAGNLFNGGTANYAIELAANGFTGLHIIENHFNSYVTSNVLNNSGGNGAHGNYIANDSFFTTGTDITTNTNFDVVNYQGGAFGGSILPRLVRPNLGGNGLVGGDIAISAAWGSTASKVITAVSRDTGGEVQITANGTGITGNPSFTVTFHDGTWGSTPYCLVGNSGETGIGATGQVRVTSRSATQFVALWEGTPSAGNTVNFTWFCWGNG